MNTSESQTPPSLKHREVERILRAEIESGIWNAEDRLPGEHELARRFQVAYMTVRQAISHLVDDGVLRRVRGKGTFVIARPDQGLALPRRARPMALIIPSDWQSNDPYYFPEVIEGFQQRMGETGDHVALLGYEAAEAPNALEAESAIACLVLGSDHVRLVERLRDEGHRVLAINRYTGRRALPCVHIDDAAGIAEAVDHLVGLGHRRIGFLRGKPGNVCAADRQRGFQAAIQRPEITETAGLIVGDGFNEAAGYAAAAALIASPKPPTALVCASDLAAIGAIRAARDCGLSVPEDISVIGFGDFSVAPYLNPGLTTVRQSRLELGAQAADLLIQLAAGEDVPNTESALPADLIVRESTAPPPLVPPVVRPIASRSSLEAAVPEKGKSHAALR